MQLSRETREEYEREFYCILSPSKYFCVLLSDGFHENQPELTVISFKEAGKTKMSLAFLNPTNMC